MSGARAETPREDAALLERDVERVVDVERASLGARTSDARARTPRVLALAVGLGALGALGAGPRGPPHPPQPPPPTVAGLIARLDILAGSVVCIVERTNLHRRGFDRTHVKYTQLTLKKKP